MVSNPSSEPVGESARERAFAWLLGLHGLSLMVTFPFGPQAARLWQPGVAGIALISAVFPLAAVVAGLGARRLARLPADPRALAALALPGALLCAFSTGYASLLAGRLLAGLAAGLGYVALHRALAPEAAARLGRTSARVVAFGMVLCLSAATALDLRFAFAPIVCGWGGLLWLARRKTRAAMAEMPTKAPEREAMVAWREPAPLALVAAAALGFVSASYLTVLSGFLVFNAGHTEWHIPAGLLVGALLGLAVPPGLEWWRARASAPVVYMGTLAAAALSLVALLGLRTPEPAVLAVGSIAVFLAINAARHLALAQLVQPALPREGRSAHQTHVHLAHHLGYGLGALAAGVSVVITPARTMGGMEVLFASGLAATALAGAAGLVAARKATAGAVRAATQADLTPCASPRA